MRKWLVVTLAVTTLRAQTSIPDGANLTTTSKPSASPTTIQMTTTMKPTDAVERRQEPQIGSSFGSMEGSGDVLDSTDQLQAMGLSLNSLTVDPTTPRNISKRAADFYNGQVDRQFFVPFVVSRPNLPPTAVLAFGRPLQRGPNAMPQAQYIALWAPYGQQPHWGAVGQNAMGKVDASFVKDHQVVNLTRPDLANTPVRLLQYVGSEQSNNFRFAWVLARDADVATVVAERDYRQPCSPRMAPAVLKDQGYEFLGEADVDSRVFFYVHNGQAGVAEHEVFTNNVYLLTKQRCRCECPLQIY